MTKNDILRRLRYTLNLKDSLVVEIFSFADLAITEDQWMNLLKHEDEENYQECDSKTLERFLDGLIIHYRGPSDRKPIQTEGALTNNLILKKLRIALEFKEEDMLQCFELAGNSLGRSEISALFRKPGHKHYRECGNQLLRHFLKGLTMKLRGHQD